MKHSKGPWKRGGPYGNLKTKVVAGSRYEEQVIATARTKKLKDGRKFPVSEDGLESWPEGEANLNLILAAEDLLEALGEVEWVYDGDGKFCPWCGNNQVYGHDPKCLRQVAIAKAKGKQ